MSTLPRSSLSDVNLFLAEPAAWFIKHMLNHRSESGPRALSGRAIETALNHYVVHRDMSVEDCQQLAVAAFREETGGEVTDYIEAEAAVIPSYVGQAMAGWNEHFGDAGVPVLQGKVGVEIEGVEVVGYLDYLFDDFLVDLKTTKSLPSAARDTHLRQMAFYAEATGRAPKLLYVTPKKYGMIAPEPGHLRAAMRHVRSALRAIARIHRGKEKWRQWADLFPPRELSSFYYDRTSRELARDIWGV